MATTEVEGALKCELWAERKSRPHVFEALEAQRMGAIRDIDIDDVPCDAGVVRVAVLFWLNRRPISQSQFLHEFQRFWSKGIRRFVVLAPEETADLPWSTLPPSARHAFEQACHLLHTPSKSAFTTILSRALATSIPDWAEHRIDETLEARLLYEAVSRFAHGSRGDLSNRFLAPARLLALKNPVLLGARKADWHEVWTGGSGSGMKSILEIVREQGSRGAELAATGEPISRWFENATDTLTPESLSRFMSLLTSCRMLAGEASKAEGGIIGQAPEPLLCENEKRPFRILVVDDHAHAWRPVFQELKSELEATAHPTEIWFSLDGRRLTDGQSLAANVQYDEFDLVILDVLLDSKEDGHDLLAEIRRSFAQRPVLLWTTSRDEELTAKASRANGILLKKTLQWDVLVRAVTIWLRKGRADRTSSLPNPFFNDAIRNQNHRDLLQSLTDWCLKQLDSFHALDGSYFRYFTDHGGRHIVKLLGLLEKALAPFLLGDGKLVSTDRAEREFELLSLYVAVVSHELGMFPMRVGARVDGDAITGGRVENFSVVGNEYLNDVRSLHAPRGMVLLADETGRFWSDEDGRFLGKQMQMIRYPRNDSVDLAKAVSVVVGYHSRCLVELDQKSFLTWTPEARARIERLGAVTPSLQPAGTLFEEMLKGLHQAIKGTDPAYSERLRRQCALFRFVDAIDMDASRNPAQFLILSPQRSAAQNRENLKRQVCRSVEIIQGQVDIDVSAAVPDAEMLSAVLGEAQTVKAIDKLGSDDIAAVSSFKEFLKGSTQWSPWDETHRNAVRAIQRPLDEWLRIAWSVLMGVPTKDSVLNHLNQIGIDAGGSSVHVKGSAWEFLASLTALAMAGEVLAEYQAVEDADLARRLRLGKFGWRPWDGGQIPKELTVLGPEALEQYPIA
jgi:DNA-binding response OmpR family regulator